MKKIILLLILDIVLIGCKNNAVNGGRWSVEKTNEWHTKQPWLIGGNFVPSIAVNQPSQ